MIVKYSNDVIGNRTRDLPACSAVLQPTAPPHTPIMIRIALLNSEVFRVCNIKMQKEKEKIENQLLMSCSSFVICILLTLSKDPVPHVRSPTKPYANNSQICSSYRGIALTSSQINV